jgi:hypothetical protein
MNFQENTPYDVLTEKWNPVLEHEALPAIQDEYRKKVTAVLLENQEQALRQQHLTEDMSQGGLGSNFSNFGGPATSTGYNQGAVSGYDPVLISLIRRSMPNLMAYDICGVQPMTAPTGLIFAMRANYQYAGSGKTYGQAGYIEAMFQEPQPSYGGSGWTLDSTFYSSKGNSANWNYGNGLTGWYKPSASAVGALRGLLTNNGEGIGNNPLIPGVGGSATGYVPTNGQYATWNQMAFSIDRVAVAARTRALSSNYTVELAQDLKAVHGLDAEAELANLLSTEILAEINREIVKTIYYVAKTGSQQNDLQYAATSLGGGVYNMDTDADGRWSAERFRGLSFQIERECNYIAKETRRGKGNFVICDSDTAAALAMSGFMSLSPAIAPQLNVDDTQSTFAGILSGKIRVYIDPYSPAGVNFFCAGYKGESPYDAGLFYCPYVPLQMVRAVDPNTFQPRIAFKTRYGVVANPYVLNATTLQPDADTLSQGLNQYYRITAIKSLHGNSY